MLKDLYITPEVEILKFKAAMAIAAIESDPGNGFIEDPDGDHEEDGDL